MVGHKGRGYEDQILWKDGFQQHPMQHSILTLLEFSNAYDTFWQEKLLLCMLGISIPMTFIQWLCLFLTDCRACVQLHNVFSSIRHLKQGLPQSSVLAPLLCLFFINDLAKNLSNDAVIALFADNISILTTASKKGDAVAAA